MNKTIIILSCLLILAGCNKGQNKTKRIAIAEVGKEILYYDEVPELVQKGINDADSAALYKNYINKWAKKQLLLQKIICRLT